MPAVGITLQPEDAFLELLGGVLREDADYFEVAPETLWAVGDDDRFRPEPLSRAVSRAGRRGAAAVRRARRGDVAGQRAPGDAPRRRLVAARSRSSTAASASAGTAITSGPTTGRRARR
jgi:hypothetical protein